jgi:broad specificity phosphatase PhoE
MGIIFFVRHGESESNKLIHDKLYTNKGDLKTKLNSYGDPALTDKGIEQAKHTAEYLFGKIKQKYSHINIFVSPIQRTVQTANEFINLCKGETEENSENKEEFKLDHSIEYLPDLQEYTNPKKNTKGKLTCLGDPLIVDESWEDFCSRVLKVVTTLEGIKNKSPSVVFGHSLFISTLCSYTSSQKNYIVEEVNDCSFKLPNCSVTPMSFNNNHWNVYGVGNIGHIPESLQTGTHY